MQTHFKSSYPLSSSWSLQLLVAAGHQHQTNAYYHCISPSFPAAYCATKIPGRVVFYEAKLAHAGPIPFHFDCLNTDEENRYCCRRALYPEAVNGDTLTVRQDEFEHGLPGEFLGDLNCYPAPADH
ncbi:hypothetical protein Pst134EA_008977 [Puccinia striiformis f. sp. tritici]|uniref:hypothetical protein n=1 Tax=Puccinia striiformis f. sp. tritici TaxID=168172 RepID=UPI002008703E|nr:hypothetical protein Pst134EA_008977 [Puccinia striiformis f. sp. tritici]KAH9468433.1 hypothetical protein Pst134EA_008977 [Puccinia striiformis f. sp. tritici]